MRIIILSLFNIDITKILPEDKEKLQSLTDNLNEIMDSFTHLKSNLAQLNPNPFTDSTVLRIPAPLTFDELKKLTLDSLLSSTA
jgi:hypothetical protein